MRPHRITCLLSAILFVVATNDVTTAEDYVILTSHWPDDRDSPTGSRYEDGYFYWPPARGEEEPEEELNSEWIPEEGGNLGKRVWGAKKERVWGKRSKRAPSATASGTLGAWLSSNRIVRRPFCHGRFVFCPATRSLFLPALATRCRET